MACFRAHPDRAALGRKPTNDSGHSTAIGRGLGKWWSF